MVAIAPLDTCHGRILALVVSSNRRKTICPIAATEKAMTAVGHIQALLALCANRAFSTAPRYSDTGGLAADMIAMTTLADANKSETMPAPPAAKSMPSPRFIPE